MRKPTIRLSRTAKATGIAVAAAGLIGGSLVYAASGSGAASGATNPEAVTTTTPIKHLVVLFGENESYDHYFGTYPKAANTDGVPFTALPNTPDNTNLLSNNSAALKSNPNSVAPFRLSYSQALTDSQSHAYSDEQKAENGDATTGTPAMNKFPEFTAHTTCSAPDYCTSGINMGYYDGNTTTALWNYAQNYALSDNSWDDNFGPSTNGALNVVSGQTYGAVSFDATTRGENPTPLAPSGSTPASNSGNVSDNVVQSVVLPTYNGAAPAAAKNVSVGTVIGDPDPAYDDCATGSGTVAGMLGQNIGDVLNAKGVSWGWFQGGFTPNTPWDGNQTDRVACSSTHNNIAGQAEGDYSPHHNPFEYYASTANPHHLPGTPGVPLGTTDTQHLDTATNRWEGANHEYDLSVFEDAIANDTIPAVSYLKAAAYQDGHPGNSDPIDEEHFYERIINALEESPEWSSTAVVIAYDDSDGWYDHVAPKILNGSKNGVNGSTDDSAVCTVPGNNATTAPKTNVDNTVEEGRCGPSQRLPLLVISPYAKKNYIDGTMTGQSSVVKFIESNWSLPTTNGSSIDDATVTGSWDARDGSIDSMFDFNAKPDLTPLVLNNDGSVQSGGYTGPSTTPPGGGTTTKPGGGTTPPPAVNHALQVAQQHLTKDKKALAKAKKQAKKAHGAKKKKLAKKVAKLKKSVKKDQRAVKAAS
jgi:phospholipase C